MTRRVLLLLLDAFILSIANHGVQAWSVLGGGSSPPKRPACQEEDPVCRQKIFSLSTTRASFLNSAAKMALIGVSTTLVTTTTSDSDKAHALAGQTGGIGGLGKTKPETGVNFWNDDVKPLQTTNGIVSAEIDVQGQPILVSFYAPAAWPLSGTAAGLEARDLAQPEAAYVHVVPSTQQQQAGSSSNGGVNVAKLAIVETTTENGAVVRGLSKSTVKDILLESVLAQQGKFGAYGSPTDVKVKKWKDATPASTKSTTSKAVNNLIAEDLGTYQVSFVTLTPGLRESERVLLTSIRRVRNTSGNGKEAALVMLVTGTTRVRFSSQQPLLERVSDSWQVTPAPPSSRSSRTVLPAIDDD